MALNFPNTPADGDNWIDPANGAKYQYSSATNSWSVTGISVGGGTVNSVDITGQKGIITSGGPITDVGEIIVRLDIDGPTPLPLLP